FVHSPGLPDGGAPERASCRERRALPSRWHRQCADRRVRRRSFRLTLRAELPKLVPLCVCPFRASPLSVKGRVSELQPEMVQGRVSTRVYCCACRCRWLCWCGFARGSPV